jgi:hypothetical protein
MRRVIREPLAADVQENLDQRQAEADRKRAAGELRVETEWQNARQTRSLRAVEATLKRMMGERQRCMYCLDSPRAHLDRQGAPAAVGAAHPARRPGKVLQRTRLLSWMN